ncbi:gamma-tubulin complex component 2 homolog [Drosophila novamexicana]|uniref:gamma-tubulin complex component 2 homolog n=1 Tax=Drosophila novamexicana TaxID=47314 RepID=UPI0011E5E2E1|nr:gamma-tubulin complex component 2 homolog [Drosophila novamexicana]
MDSEASENVEPRVRFRLGKAEDNAPKEDATERSADVMEPTEDGSTAGPARFKRKLGSWIFESVGGFYMPTEDISKLPARRQEHLLIRDLIYAFSGVPSSHIRPEMPYKEISQLRTDQVDKVRFKIDESFSGAFRTLANELLPLIGYYINVQGFIEDTIMTTGCARTLGIALHKSMQQYFELQAGLETQLQERKLDLQQLVHQLRPWLKTMHALASLTSRVRRSELNSAQLLSLMDEHQAHFKCEQLKLILSDVSHYYMKMVQLWTQKGVLYDVRREFFVEDTSASDMSSTLLSPKQCCHAYWAQRYRLHMERLPSFLAAHAERIFLAGKYLNVLRQCNVQMKLMQASLIYVPPVEMDGEVEVEAAHVALIRSSYELPARKLLELLVKEEQLLQHLNNLQDYFLLQRLELVEAVLDNCAGQLQCNVDSLKPEKLQQIMLQLLQQSTDPHKHLLRSQLMDCDVATQLARRHKRLIKSKPEQNFDQEQSSEVEASSETDSSQLPAQLAINGYEAFTLRYEPKWPISLVIHEDAVEQLQLLHRVLFYLHYVLRQMGATPKHGARADALLERMTECIRQLEQHMTGDIVQPRWQTLLENAQKAQFVDELLQQFQDTLDQCQLLCLLSAPATFVRALHTLGQLCLNYSSFLERQGGGPDFEAGVAEYEQELNSLLIGILDLLIELARPNSASGHLERESCKQLLKRLEHVSQDLGDSSASSENSF